MTRWIKTIDIKQHLTDEETPEAAKRVGAAIAKTVEFGTRHWVGDLALEEILDNLRNVEDTDDVNNWLEELYNWADRNLVWLG